MTKEIWSLGHRPSYANRLNIAAFGNPKGPYGLEDICGQSLPYADRAKDWTSPYLDDMRQLALSFWVGSEFDIAVLRTGAGHQIQRPVTRVYHEFNALTNKGLQLQHGFSWVEQLSCHIAAGHLDYIELISYLLSYYQAVFFDDLIREKSRIYFHREMVRKMPQKIKIQRGNGSPNRFLKDEMQCHSLVLDQNSILRNDHSY